jgi:hypothetical protein
MAAGLSDWLELDDDMIEYLAGTKRKTKKIIAQMA